MNMELVRFVTSDGLELEGLLSKPDKKSDKIVIHVHGSVGNFYENKFINNFLVEYAERGWAFLSFNNRGAELEREKVITQNGTQKDIVCGFLHETFEECIFDIDAAIKFAKDNGYRQIVLQGHSLGCNKVVYYSINKNFEGDLVLIAPCDLASMGSDDPAHIGMMLKAKKLLSEGKGDERLSGFWGRLNISAHSFVSVWAEDGSSDLFRYRNGHIVPILASFKNNILVEMGKKDEFIVQEDKCECVDYLKKAFSNANLTAHLIDNTGHDFGGKQREMALNIIDWLCG